MIKTKSRKPQLSKWCVAAGMHKNNPVEFLIDGVKKEHERGVIDLYNYINRR